MDPTNEPTQKTQAHGSLYDWMPAQPPVLEPTSVHVTGRLRHCYYCGSMHPHDLAEALRAGATTEWSDFKYGWPHKLYVDNIPNPHAGMPEVRMSSNRPDPRMPREVHEPRYDQRTGERLPDAVYYTEEPKPATEKTHGKFYTVHLKDATAEDREVIEKAMGRRFEFTPDGLVKWKPYEQATDAGVPTEPAE